MEIVAKENKVIVMDHNNETMTEEFVEDPMEIPRKISEKWNPDPQLVQDLPDAFCGKRFFFIVYNESLSRIVNLKGMKPLVLRTGDM